MVSDNTETVTNTQHLAAAANGIKLITPSFRAISSCITVQWGVFRRLLALSSPARKAGFKPMFFGNIVVRLGRLNGDCWGPM